MFHRCERCNWDDSIETDEPEGTTATCTSCGDRYELEPDFDWTGDGYVDCSSLGKLIERGGVKAPQ